MKQGVVAAGPAVNCTALVTDELADVIEYTNAMRGVAVGPVAQIALGQAGNYAQAPRFPGMMALLTAACRWSDSMQPFGPNDLAQAQRIYTAADPNARALLDWFIAHPDQRADGATIAAELGFPDNRLVGRATYALGLAASEEGRARPWHESQMGYLMTGEMAALFGSARG